MKRRTKIISIALMIITLTLLGVYLSQPIQPGDNPVENDTALQKGKEAYLKNPGNSQTKKPNIIILFADDLGRFDISLYDNKSVPTPNIDSLANQGTTFTSGYTSAPICSPSRAGLITGRYQERFGYEAQPSLRYPKNKLELFVFDNFIKTGAWKVNKLPSYPNASEIKQQGIPTSEITFGELFKANGYKTAVIGKWHLGFEEPFHPNKRGFDYYYGFYQSHSMFAAESDTVNIINHHHSDFTDKFIWGDGTRKGPTALYRNENIIEEKEYITDKFGSEAVQFIEQNKDNPFFLYVPFNAPHTPFQAKKADYNLFKDEQDINKRTYYAMIKSLDDAIGQITAKVSELGIEENTIIYFLSDNGGAAYTLATDNAPLKGGKFSHFEGGINIPFAVKWKGHIPAGQIYDQPVISLDIFATSAAAAGIALPADRTYDGVNLIPFLNKQTQEVPHKALFWRAGRNKAIRKGDWKLIVSEIDKKTYLYNLKQDPSEKNNLTGTEKAKLNELSHDLSNWEKTLTKPKWPSFTHYEFEFEDGKYNVDL